MKLGQAGQLTGGIVLSSFPQLPLFINFSKVGSFPASIKGKIASKVKPSIPTITSFPLVLFFNFIEKQRKYKFKNITTYPK